MIKVLIVSINCHEELHLPISKAVDFIKDQCANRHKWVYLDGDYANPDSINERNLQNAEKIILTDVLAGG